MSRKAKTTKKQILAAAVKLVRKDGPDALTTKALAAKLKCSTQPIFWNYSGMGEVREEVTRWSFAKFDKELRREVPEVSPYLAVGLNYIRFAKEEPELFKFLFMNKAKEGQDVFAEQPAKAYVLGVIEQTEKLSGARAEEVFEEMWLLSHGIATMLATGTASFSEERIRRILTDVYRGISGQA